MIAQAVSKEYWRPFPDAIQCEKTGQCVCLIQEEEPMTGKEWFEGTQFQQVVQAAHVHEAVRATQNWVVKDPKGFAMIGPVIAQLQWEARPAMPSMGIEVSPNPKFEQEEIRALLTPIFSGKSQAIPQEEFLRAMCAELLNDAQPLVIRFTRLKTTDLVRQLVTYCNVGLDVWLLTFAVYVKERAEKLALIQQHGLAFVPYYLAE